MTAAYCEFCHTATGLHLPDCPTVVPDPYADDQQVGLWGSAFGVDMNGTKRPQGKPEDIPTTMITPRARNV